MFCREACRPVILASLQRRLSSDIRAGVTIVRPILTGDGGVSSSGSNSDDECEGDLLIGPGMRSTPGGEWEEDLLIDGRTGLGGVSSSGSKIELVSESDSDSTLAWGLGVVDLTLADTICPPHPKRTGLGARSTLGSNSSGSLSSIEVGADFSSLIDMPVIGVSSS